VSLRALEDLAAIHRTVDPLMSVGSYGQPFPPAYSFEGSVLGTIRTEEDAAAVADPRKVRAIMLGRAEEILGALGTAGWQIYSFGIEITCSPPGPPLVKLRFTVTRAPTAAEKASDPDRVAADLWPGWQPEKLGDEVEEVLRTPPASPPSAGS
jgi:hypothetical protein